MAQTLPVGAKLPAERSFATSFNCNFLTVRKALKRIVDDGTIVRRVGSGTFIARHRGGDGMGGGARKKLGILVYRGSNAYAYSVLQALAHSGLEQDVEVGSGWVGNFRDEALQRANEFSKEGCVALTLPWFPHEMADEVREFAKRSPLPFSIALPISGLESNCFVEPRVFGSSIPVDEICRYFQSLGHQRIALIGPDSSTDVYLQKMLTGFVCYASRENLPSPCGLVPEGAAAMDQLADRWKQYKGELAIIAYDDEHALKFMTAMHKIGLTAPKDYSIIGYNDTDASRFSDPPLSTIHQNFDFIAHWLVMNALALAEGSVSQASKDPLLHLLVRQTCGGKGEIDENFQTQFNHLKITVDEEPARDEMPAIVS